MATDKAKFEVELVDSYSGRVRKIRAANKKMLDDQVAFIKRNKASMAAAKARNRQEVAGAKIRSKAIHGIFGAATQFAKWATIGGVIGAGLFGAKASKRIEETEATVFALDQLTHQGKKTFREISDLSKNLGLDIDDTAHSFANFLKLQFPEAQAKKLIALGADMQALGNSADDIQGIFRALGQIRSKGRVQAEEMLQLAERGVSQELIMTSVARNRGIEDPSGQAARVQVQKLQQAGEISAAEFFVAFEEAINTKLGQSQAGQSAQAFVSKTFRGAKGRLQAEATDFWIQVADMAKPGLKEGFDKLSDHLGDFFKNERSAQQLERIMAVLGQTFAAVGDTLGYLLPKAIEAADVFGVSMKSGFESVSGKGETAIDVLDRMKRLIDLMIPAAELLGKSIGFIAGGIDRIGQAQESISQLIGGRSEADIAKESQAWAERKRATERETAAMNQGLATGAAWGDGLGAGILSKRDMAYAASIGLAGLVDQGFRDEAEIHSPSRKAMELGKHWSDGLAMGMEANAPSSVLPGGKMPVGLRSKAGGSRSITVGDITIKVDGSADPQQTAQATLRAFERNLGSVIGRMAGEAAA